MQNRKSKPNPIARVERRLIAPVACSAMRVQSVFGAPGKLPTVAFMTKGAVVAENPPVQGRLCRSATLDSRPD